MLEAPVENRLTSSLEAVGFKVLKLVTPGSAGSMDRLILRPKWSPGAPHFVECKRPGKEERRLQAVVRDDWRARGVIVEDCVSTYEEVDALVGKLIALVKKERTDGRVTESD
jgi:hypothetical protein